VRGRHQIPVITGLGALEGGLLLRQDGPHTPVQRRAFDLIGTPIPLALT